MVTIRVLDHVPHCVSNDDGHVVFQLIKSSLDAGQPVTLSFSGVYAVPTSFVNSALIELLSYYALDAIKARVSFVDTTRQINSVIKKRFAFETGVGKDSAHVHN